MWSPYRYLTMWIDPFRNCHFGWKSMLSLEVAVYELGSDSSFPHILLMMIVFFFSTVYSWSGILVYCLWLVWYFRLLSIVGSIFWCFQFKFIVFSSKCKEKKSMFEFIRIEGHFSWKCITVVGRGPNSMRPLRLKKYLDCIENSRKAWLQHVLFVW